MINRHLEGAVRNVGSTQGWIGISVLCGTEVIQVDDGLGGTVPQTVRTVTTAWEPDPAELERLNRGASVRIKLLTPQWPPCMIDVGEAP